MATAHSAMQMMRKVCLSLPNASEAEHFGEACFRVGKRMFATCGEKTGVCRIVVQLEPEHAARLVASDPRFQPYTRQKNCIWIDVAEVEDWDEVRPLVLESYRLNAPDIRPPKRTRKTPRKRRSKN